MLKNILNLQEVKTLGKEQQRKIAGGTQMEQDSNDRGCNAIGVDHRGRSTIINIPGCEGQA